jgi:large subunit ribosomal protein L3
MSVGILGRKVGMTRIYDEAGQAVAVTVIKAGPCVVVQRKTAETDGYEAVQLGFEDRNRRATNAPLTGHFESRNLSPKKYLREFPVAADGEYAVGDEVTVEIFEPGQAVSVAGTTKGKGFAGVMKRYRTRGGPASHGASKVHRVPGSAGGTDAARVFPGQKMPGQMGASRTKVKGLQVVDVDAENHLLVLKGAVPGPSGGLLIIEGN